MSPVIHVEDRFVSEELDRNLRELISLCFPHQPLFKTQRFYKENPVHRWYVERGDRIIAHVALHDKRISRADVEYRIGGIAEVAVHPDHRGRGHVRKMLNPLHRWLSEESFDFAMLFGREEIYASSGYRRIGNAIRHFDVTSREWKEERMDFAMVAKISGLDWSDDGVVDLRGPTF